MIDLSKLGGPSSAPGLQTPAPNQPVQNLIPPIVAPPNAGLEGPEAIYEASGNNWVWDKLGRFVTGGNEVDEKGSHGNFVADLPVIGDVLRVPGNITSGLLHAGGVGVGAVVGGIAELMGRVPSFTGLTDYNLGTDLNSSVNPKDTTKYGPTPEGAARLMMDLQQENQGDNLARQFMVLGQWQQTNDPEAFRLWQQTLDESNKDVHKAGEYISNYLRYWGTTYVDLTPEGMEGWLEVHPELAFGGAGSFGQGFVDGLGAAMTAQRHAEKGAAVLSGRQAGLNLVNGLPSKQVYDGHTDMGSRLNELLYLNDTDPRRLSEPEKAAVHGLTELGWTADHAYNFLVREGQGYSSDGVSQVVTSIALDPLFVAGIGAEAPAQIARTALQAGAKTATSASRIGAINNAMTKSIGTTVQAVRENPVLGPAARIARGIVDPIGALGRGPAGLAKTDVFAAAGLEGTTRGFGYAAVTEGMRRAESWGVRPVLDRTYAMSAMNLARKWVGTEHIASLLRFGNPSARRIIPEDVLQNLGRSAPKDATTRLADFVQRNREYWLTKAGTEALVERIVKLVDQPVEDVRAAVATMSRDEQAWWHMNTYSHAFESFEKLKASLPAELWGKLGERLDDLTILNPQSIDNLTAQQLLADIGKIKDPKAKIKFWNDAAKQYDLIDGIGSVTVGGVNELERRLNALQGIIERGGIHTAVGADEIARLPERFRKEFLDTWVDSNGERMWRLGFKPKAEQATGLIYNDMGELVQAFSPSIDNVTTGIARRPGRPQPITDALGRVLKDTRPVRAGTALKDSIDVALKTAGDTITGARMITSMEQRFVASLRQMGFSGRTASKVFKLSTDYARDHGFIIAGLGPDDFWRATKSELTHLVDERVAKRDIFTALAHAAGGDMRTLGLSGGMTQRIRAGLIAKGLDPSNYLGAVTVQTYNRLRFALNPIYFLQLFADAPWFNMYRGVMPDLTGRVAKAGSASYEMRQITQAMGRSSLARDLAMDVTERTAVIGWQETVREAMMGMPGVQGGVAKSIKNWLGRMRLENELRYMNSKVGEVVFDALEETRRVVDDKIANAASDAERQLWMDVRYDQVPMLDWLREDMTRTMGRVPTDEEIGRRYLSEMIEDSRLEIRTPEGLLDYSKVRAKGAYHTPSRVGELRPLDLDYGVESLALPNIHDAKTLRRALKDGDYSIADIKDMMKEAGVHPDAIKRFATAMTFEWREYFDGMARTLGMSNFEMQAIEDLVAAQAKMAGMSALDYITQVMPMNARYEAKVAAQRAAIEKIEKASQWKPRPTPAKAPESVYTHTSAKGGGTFDVATGKEMALSDGFGVGLGSKGVVVDNTAEAVKAGYAEVSKVGSPHIGTWLNPADGKVYIDPTNVVKSRADAINLARSRGEKAIYDFKAGKDITITPGSVASTTAEIDRDLKLALDVFRLAGKGEAGVDDLTKLVAANLQPSMKSTLIDHFIEQLERPGNGLIAEAEALGKTEFAAEMREVAAQLRGGWGNAADDMFRDLVMKRAGGTADAPAAVAAKFGRDARGNAVLPTTFKAEPGYIYRIETPDVVSSGWNERTGVSIEPNPIYAKDDKHAIYRSAVPEDKLAPGRAGGKDRLTTEYIHPDNIEYLGEDGLWHKAPSAIPEPEVERAARFFSAWMQGVGPSVQAGDVLRGVIDNIPIEGASPANVTESLVMGQLSEGMRLAEKDAIRLADMQTERSVLERSLNHPFFAMYPSSYFWGKVIPETLRFIALEPFGIRTGMGLSAYEHVRQSLDLQSQYDPRLKDLWDKVGKSAIMGLFSYVTPSLPWEDMRSNLPPWVRALARGRDFAGILTSEFDTFSPERWVNRFVEAGEEAGDIVGNVVQSLSPTEQQGLQQIGPGPGASEPLPPVPDLLAPTKGTQLGPVLQGELDDLQRVLSGN